MLKLPMPPEQECECCTEWKTACVSTAQTAEKALARLVSAMAVVDAVRTLVKADPSIGEGALADLAGELIDALRVFDGRPAN